MGVRGRDNYYYYIELSVSHSQDVWQRYGQEMCVCVCVCVCVCLCVCVSICTCVYSSVTIHMYIHYTESSIECHVYDIVHLHSSTFMYDTHVCKFLS